MIIKTLLKRNQDQLNSRLLLYIMENSSEFGLIIIFGKVFVSSDYIKNTPFMFACTLSDHTPNTLLLTSIKKYNCWKVFIESYKIGSLRFESMKIKNITTELISKIINK